ncbi:MAG TPA: 50S ribosomal protein L11 methyltransferase [Defluviitaleaceae bacterium]|jgi:ribosomal protein L11 methyltransferase|nr:50S ribosomal protein L11 methyltransferase [Candidatus Epulonipiscium sp.]HOQ17327.1 50S ribosomal protein L11 methyltransferase [Defluviitaleaceae bacterium]HPT75385.1 50S ribosomal protein L11 methyltransferase [Defluviitaleaceae bacterium]HQD51226.1 50S ribosomal protein L11 methyltransferase [Defluviitaleaceae bacterium]
MYNLDWIRIIIKTNSQGQEAIGYALSQLGIQAVEIEDPFEIITAIEKKKEETQVQWDYIDEELIQNNKDEVLIKAYLAEDTPYEDKIIQIQEKINHIKSFLDIGSGEIEIEKVNEEDWAESWKKYYKPFRLGKHIIIKPIWEEYSSAEKNDIIVEMDPGMAFGTGTHETTSMCIELLEKYLNENACVFDIGCGSGILSIVAAKLGADHVIAVDLDSNAVEASKKNVALNQLQEKVRIFQGNLLDNISEKADIVVANIIADVIIQLSNSVPDYLKNEALFIASGIIKERKDEVISVLERNGFNIIEITEKGEWCALVAQKRSE